MYTVPSWRYIVYTQFGTLSHNGGNLPHNNLISGLGIILVCPDSIKTTLWSSYIFGSWPTGLKMNFEKHLDFRDTTPPSPTHLQPKHGSLESMFFRISRLMIFRFLSPLIFRGVLGGSSHDLDTWLLTMVIGFVPKTRCCGTPYKWPFNFWGKFLQLE